MGLDLDNWIDKVRKCEYLLEDELKQLCEYVSVLFPLRASLERAYFSFWMVARLSVVFLMSFHE